MHASASRYLHGDRSAWSDGNASSLLTYGIRKDGFVALTPSTSDAVGLLVLRPVQWGGGELLLNANCSGADVGSIRVELRDADSSTPLPGYTVEDSAVFASDSLAWQAVWGSNNRTMASLSGRALRVAVELRGSATRLYALRGRWNGVG